MPPPPDKNQLHSPGGAAGTGAGAGGREPSSLALPLFLVVLASSAGFTLYTKRTGSMLRSMEQINQNMLRNHPPKYGPPTKEQYEKLRPRIDKDEFF